MFVTDTLGNPYAEVEELGSLYAHDLRIPAAGQRDQAQGTDHRRHRQSAVQGEGEGPRRWIEGDTEEEAAPLAAWIPPADWGVGRHAKHLRNLYVYFWRWATWKVFDHDPKNDTGIVCFITVAGFLNGPGFQRMRDYLRRTADAHLGHRLLARRPPARRADADLPGGAATGVHRPGGAVEDEGGRYAGRGQVHRLAGRQTRREIRGAGQTRAQFEGPGKTARPTGEHHSCPRPPAPGPAYPTLDDLFAYNGSGVMPGRTWVIAPDADHLRRRWQKLVKRKPEQKGRLCSFRICAAESSAIRHVDRVVKKGLPGYPTMRRRSPTKRASASSPVRYGFRSFDRQWIIPDNRVINQPNPELWRAHSDKQVYLDCLNRTLADLRTSAHFHRPDSRPRPLQGSFGGRVFPALAGRRRDDAEPAAETAGASLRRQYKKPVTAEDFLAYLAGRGGQPGVHGARFNTTSPNPACAFRSPPRPKLFAKAVELGRRVIWLHTFGERFADPKADRPPGPPRLPKATSAPHPQGRRDPGRSRCHARRDDLRRKQAPPADRHGLIDNVPPRCGSTKSPASGY